MRVSQYEFVYVNGHLFLSPLTDQYGEFILHSTARRTPKYLFAIDDEVYNEVEQMLKSVREFQEKNQQSQATILQKVFGAACDCDADGSEFLIGAMPRCPQCGSCEMESWDLPHNPKTEEVSEVTHTFWQRLGSPEKLDRLNARLKQLGVIKPPP